MFGVFIFNHADLRRILTDYGFKGYPLRKDFPLTGFVELLFNLFGSGLVFAPVGASQYYRNFALDLSVENAPVSGAKRPYLK